MADAPVSVRVDFDHSTYVGTTSNLGAALLLIQVVCLDIFYGVIFAPDEIGWDAAGEFGGSVIAFGTIVLFDNWLWPDRGEEILMASLGSERRARSFTASRGFKFLSGCRDAPRPPIPPPTSDLPSHMALLNRAVVGRCIRASPCDPACRYHARRADFPRSGSPDGSPLVRTHQDRFAPWHGPKLKRRWRRLPRCWTRSPANCRRTSPLASILRRPPRGCARDRRWTRLIARVLQVRPTYIGKASSTEVENFATFADSLTALTGHIERLLDEPPQPPAATRDRCCSAD